MNKILIIDDDPITRKYVSHILTVGGYQVEMAADGKEAIFKARRQIYDAAIVDLVLPGELNGMDIIKNLKSFSPKTRIIAFTAFSGEAFGAKTANAGADAFVSKSYMSDQLLSTVNKLLGKNRENPENIFTQTYEPASSMQNPLNEFTVKESKPIEPIIEPEIFVEPESIMTPPPEKIKVTPKILLGLSDNIISQILNYGTRVKINPGDKYYIKYTLELAIVISGEVRCFYRDKNFTTIKTGESIAEESIFLDDDSKFSICLESENEAEILIIPKEKLENYLTETDKNIFIIYQTNVILSLSRKLTKTIKSSPHQPVIKKQISANPAVSKNINTSSDMDIIELLQL